MANRVKAGLAWAAIGLLGASLTAPAQQVIERDTRLTGPRGRTIERDIRVERGPGYVDRKIEIKRPGETLVRDTRVETGYPGHHRGPGPGHFGGPPRVFERDVIIERPPLFSSFVAAPFFSLFLGNPAPPPPPPVVFVPEPVYIPQPQPVYAYPPPVAPIVVQAPPPTPADPLAGALGRLRSHHGPSRRDGALTLGRIGDDRAVGPLIDRLERDGDRDVRVASAWALGEIGDDRAALALEKAALYDKKHEVREAANIGYRKLPKPGQSSAPAAIEPQSQVITSQPQVLDPGPSARGSVDDTPPPPPVPANGPALEAPASGSPFRNPS